MNKTCSKCNETKQAIEFGKDSSKKDGLRSECKVCQNKREALRRTKPKVINQRYKASLKQKYGIDVEEYNRLFEAQKGCCKICNKHQTEFKKKLSVDHNHTTGKVRGLLCDSCNRGLGFLQDSPNTVASALEYLLEEGHYG